MDYDRLAEKITEVIQNNNLVRVEYGYEWWWKENAEGVIAKAISEYIENKKTESDVKTVYLDGKKIGLIFQEFPDMYPEDWTFHNIQEKADIVSSYENIIYKYLPTGCEIK